MVGSTAAFRTAELPPGTLFHSRYEIREKLGQGGMGVVYKAHDRTLDETVAIKILRPDFGQDADMAKRFQSEVKLARKVRHKNVCTIHDYGDDKGLLFISMELVEGVDLKQIVRTRGALPAEEAYGIAIQIAEGLQAVHDAGIIHRDLKTPNIMVEPSGLARLMDFGVAKKKGTEGTMTALGQVVGTPEYMSPEQAQGKKLDFRSDVYALGVLTYEIFTGHVPFRGETPISTILKHLQDPPPLDGPSAAQVPEDARNVLRRALAKEPEDRYGSAREFAEALRQARQPHLRQQPMPTEVLEAATIRRKAVSRWPAVGWGAFVLLILGGLYLMRQPNPTPTPPITAPPISIEAPHVRSPPPTLATLPAEPTPAPTPTPRPKPSLAPPTAAPVVRPKATDAPAPPSPTPPPTPPPSAAPSGAGLLQVAVHPWGEVSVDGNVIGTTPMDKIPLTAGVHTLRVRHPAYELFERRVTILPGQTEHVVLDFPSQGVKKH
jgi:serine/threonine protein kinase